MRTKNVIYITCFLALILTGCFNQRKEETFACGVKDEPVLTCGGSTSKQMPAIFLARCTTCHLLDATATGPKFSGVLNRIPNEEWFDLFVRNEDSLIQQKEPYTLVLNKRSLPIQFSHHFNDFTDELMEELKEYSRE